jgi:hypothetical protein
MVGSAADRNYFPKHPAKLGFYQPYSLFKGQTISQVRVQAVNFTHEL